MESFWEKLARPIMALAPMANVTDAAFRRVIARYGKPDVLWTEFCSADGLWHTRVKRGVPDAENPLMFDLMFSASERPIVAQFFTADPAMMEYAAAVAVELGFDGVDINMGCPDRTVEACGAGAALMKNPTLAREIIRAAKRGAGGLPVSVKTRIGYARDEVATWLPALLAEDLAAVTLHARTRKEMSLVPARWEHVAEAVRLRDALGVSTVILGNGDVDDLADARERVIASHADGAMLGRAIFGNPWCFSHDVLIEDVPLAERLRVMVEHAQLFEQILPHKSFAVMRRHFKAYVSGFHGAAELRAALMETESSAEVAAVVRTAGFSPEVSPLST
ncbi:MAG: tRNA-dihydrouridine synthase [bacterium]|nr:tRNA-dihydrouridine synthase [bacterium]